MSDGASGAGREGKVMMSKCCVENIENNPFLNSNLTAKEYLDKMIWKINNDLIKISQESNNYIFGTLIICIIYDDVVTLASVGDSPAYFIRDNNIKRIVKPKKTYQSLIDMGLFTEEQLEEYIHKLPEHMWSMFDRFIPSVVPSYSIEEYVISSGDIIVLCCDGVSDYVNENELIKLIDHTNISNSVNDIIDIAKQNSIKERNKNQYDDITLIIYQHI